MTDVDYHAIARELSRTEDLSWLSDWLPYAPPPGWRLAAVAEDGRAYRSDDGLVAVMSGSTEQDGRRWIHLSVSRKDRLPSWDDLVRVRDAFLGPEVEAYQVIPPRSRYVNICPTALHIWTCVDGTPLPDFTRGTGSL